MSCRKKFFGVGGGEQLAASIAADPDQRRVGRQPGALPGVGQHPVDALAQAAQQFFGLAVLAELGDDNLALGLQALPEAGLGTVLTDGGGAHGCGLPTQAGTASCLLATMAGGAGVPADTVSTS